MKAMILTIFTTIGFSAWGYEPIYFGDKEPPASVDIVGCTAVSDGTTIKVYQHQSRVVEETGPRKLNRQINKITPVEFHVMNSSQAHSFTNGVQEQLRLGASDFEARTELLSTLYPSYCPLLTPKSQVLTPPAQVDRNPRAEIARSKGRN